MAEGGACAAVAAINSFIFLQNHHPDTYDTLLVPDDNPATPENETDEAARDFAEAEVRGGGWVAPDGSARRGYYERLADGEDPNKAFLDTKMDWIGDFAPGSTVFSAMVNSSLAQADWDLTITTLSYPSLDYLANEVGKEEDVEFFIKNIFKENGPGPDDDVGEGEETYHSRWHCLRRGRQLCHHFSGPE